MDDFTKNSRFFSAFLLAGVLTSPLAFVAGCASADPEPSEDQPPVGAGDQGTGGASTSTGGNTSAGMGGDTLGSGGNAVAPEPDVLLPVVVTEAFVPSGFMGREGTKNEIDGVTMDETGCVSRAPAAAGVCYKVTYAPQELDMSGSTWAGVYFQNVDQNWGEYPGVIVESGATKLVFTAWADAPLTVEFLGGGIGGLGTLYGDTFKVNKVVELSTEKVQYEIDLSAEDYSGGVLGGFGWVIAADSLEARVFYLDDVRWVK